MLLCSIVLPSYATSTRVWGCRQGRVRIGWRRQQWAEGEDQHAWKIAVLHSQACLLKHGMDRPVQLRSKMALQVHRRVTPFTIFGSSHLPAGQRGRGSQGTF